MSETPLLDVHGLSVTYAGGAPPVRAVDDVSFRVNAGETVALVGESGCGKTSAAFALMRLLPPAAAIGSSSSVHFDGADLLALDERAMRDIRGRRMAMIFQEPASALNPVMKIGAQVAEVALLHGERSKKLAWGRAVAMLERTRIANPARCANMYPHELSGGMRQRALIAMALMLSPALVIADEPTSALDVTVQAQILELLRDLQRETGMAVLLITHDFGVVAELCSRAMVMRAGKILEDAPVDDIFHAPKNAYTAELLSAVPRLSADR